MVAIVHTVDAAIRPDGDAVRGLEVRVGPGCDERAVALVDDHAGLAARQEIDPIVGVHRDACDVPMVESGGKLLPALHHVVLEVASPETHVNRPPEQTGYPGE